MEKEFISLINEHRGIIYKVCHLYDRDKVYREDLFQEIVLQLWKSFPSFDNRSLITTWMYRVALNTAICPIGRPRNPGSQKMFLPYYTHSFQ